MRQSMPRLEASLNCRHRPVTRKWWSKLPTEGRAFQLERKSASSTSFIAPSLLEEVALGSDSPSVAASSRHMADGSGPRTAPVVARFFDLLFPCLRSSLRLPPNRQENTTHHPSRAKEFLCHRKRRSFS